MQQPTRLISTPFAQEGNKTEIQNVTGEFDNSATYRLGFPPLTMQSIRLGGKPPKGTDFNGIFFDITENISFLCKGGRYQYNAGLSTLIGGYPEGSNLLLDDNVTEVVSIVAGNQNNPNTNMTGWTFKPNRTTADYVLDASGKNQQEVNNVTARSVKSIAEMLAITSPFNGQIINVNSYLPPVLAEAMPYKGGDNFEYQSSLSSVNNGVTIFNGWIRVRSKNELTSYDVGLTGNPLTDGDAQPKLQQLASACSNGTKVELFGDFKVSTNVRFVNLSNLDVSGGSIEGDVDNWVFGANLQSGTTAYGALIFDTCPDAQIHGIKAKGVRKNVFGDFQAGDSCIQLYASPRSKIFNNTLHNTYAWAILSESADDVWAYDNIIYDVVKQSGISLNHGGSTRTKAYANTIINVGLYGVEIEDQTAFNANKYFECYDNLIIGCTIGITATGNGLAKGVIQNNRLWFNRTSIWVVNSNAITGVSVLNNPIFNTRAGIIVQDFINANVLNNPVFGESKSSSYYKISPDDLILKKLSTNSFMMKRGFTPSVGTAYFGGTPYTVTNVSNYTDATGEFALDNGSPIEFSEVTIDQAVTDDMIFKFREFYSAAGNFGETGVTVTSGCSGANVYGNTIDGFLYLTYCNALASYSPALSYNIKGNNYGRYGTNAVQHEQDTTFVYYESNNFEVKGGTALSVPDNLIANGYFRAKTVRSTLSTVAKSSSTAEKAINFYFPYADSTFGFMLYSANATTTGVLKAKLSSANVYVDVATGTLSAGAFFRYNAGISKGANILTVSDSVGNLAYSEIQIDIFVL